MKYWINEAPGDDKFVIWDGSTIYKANPKKNEITDFESSLKMGKIPEGNFAINRSMIRKIELVEGKKFICIYFGKESYEHFRITNIVAKTDLFQEISKTTSSEIRVKELTTLEKTRIQRNAFIVLSILFAIGFYFANAIENGELANGEYPVIFLFLGLFGRIGLACFYFAVVFILSVKFYLESQKNIIIHTIILK